MLIDTHAHINFSSFEKDREEVIKKSLDNDVWMINVGTNLKTSQEVVDIAQQHHIGIYAAIGLHPINLDTGLVKIKFDANEGKHLEKEFDYEKYKKLALRSPALPAGRFSGGSVVAIGEIGLDYYWKPKTAVKKELFKQKQKDLLLQQLKLAQEVNLPVIFHCRMAHEELLEILRGQKGINGVVHCFTGTWNQAQQYMEMGFYLGFNGIIFKLDFDEIIKKIPLESILIETDCPYLLPPSVALPCRQAGLAKEGPVSDRNEPLYVKYVAQRIAKLKSIDLEAVAETTTQNAKTLFNL